MLDVFHLQPLGPFFTRFSAQEQRLDLRGVRQRAPLPTGIGRGEEGGGKDGYLFSWLLPCWLWLVSCVPPPRVTALARQPAPPPPPYPAPLLPESRNLFSAASGFMVVKSCLLLIGPYMTLSLMVDSSPTWLLQSIFVNPLPLTPLFPAYLLPLLPSSRRTLIFLVKRIVRPPNWLWLFSLFCCKTNLSKVLRRHSIDPHRPQESIQTCQH